MSTNNKLPLQRFAMILQHMGISMRGLLCTICVSVSASRPPGSISLKPSSSHSHGLRSGEDGQSYLASSKASREFAPYSCRLKEPRLGEAGSEGEADDGRHVRKHRGDGAARTSRSWSSGAPRSWSARSTASCTPRTGSGGVDAGASPRSSATAVTGSLCWRSVGGDASPRRTSTPHGRCGDLRQVWCRSSGPKDPPLEDRGRTDVRALRWVLAPDLGGSVDRGRTGALLRHLQNVRRVGLCARAVREDRGRPLGLTEEGLPELRKDLEAPRPCQRGGPDRPAVAVICLGCAGG
jgi:hypothetical protein